VKVIGGKGVLLVNGEAFAWCPWGDGKRMVDVKGQFEVGEGAWGVLGLVWPKPGMSISVYSTVIGLGLRLGKAEANLL